MTGSEIDLSIAEYIREREARNAAFDREVAAIRADLEYPHDGPVTAFGLISRALETVTDGRDPYVVANALHDTLLAFGYLEPEDDRRLAVNTADGR